MKCTHVAERVLWQWSTIRGDGVISSVLGQRQMSIFLQAFRVGKQAVLADATALEELQSRYSDRLITLPNMSRFASRTVRIKSACMTDGYQFDEIEGRWMEEAILDPCMQPANVSMEMQSFAPANQTYFAVGDGHAGSGYVSIVDNAEELILRFRSNNPDRDAQRINRIASIRCRIAFEINLGFCPR